MEASEGMTWYVWAVVAVLVLSAVSTVAMIGKPREPLAHNVAVASLVICGLIIWAIFNLAERCA